jgi:hypothetical protein
VARIIRDQHDVMRRFGYLTANGEVPDDAEPVREMNL